MNIILLTQNDPFYLAETTNDFIEKINNTNKHKIIMAIVSSPSPFGKKEKSSTKILKILKIFGFRFFIFYSFKYVIRKFILRKSVISIINSKSIPIWELKGSINSPESVEKIRKLNSDVIVIIAGNQIIKKQVLEVPKYGVINAHSSLLPEYKGLMPTFWVLKNMEEETGVTVFKLTEGIDDGPILVQGKIKIEKSLTQSELVMKSKYLANDLIINALNIIDNENLFLKNTGGTYFKFPTRKDVDDFYKNGKQFF